MSENVASALLAVGDVASDTMDEAAIVFVAAGIERRELGRTDFGPFRGGFDPDVDVNTLTRGDLGRRVDPQNPANSLFLLKGTGSVPHQGGVPKD